MVGNVKADFGASEWCPMYALEGVLAIHRSRTISSLASRIMHPAPVRNVFRAIRCASR